MKTVKEAAQEYAAQERTARSEYAAFIAGVEFAQRWISVEEEMPEHAQNVFMKTQSGYITGGYYEYATFRYIDDRLCYGVTHWRPAELK
jgi:hypothetical protein